MCNAALVKSYCLFGQKMVFMSWSDGVHLPFADRFPRSTCLALMPLPPSLMAAQQVNIHNLKNITSQLQANAGLCCRSCSQLLPRWATSLPKQIPMLNSQSSPSHQVIEASETPRRRFRSDLVVFLLAT